MHVPQDSMWRGILKNLRTKQGLSICQVNVKREYNSEAKDLRWIALRFAQQHCYTRGLVTEGRKQKKRHSPAAVKPGTPAKVSSDRPTGPNRPRTPAAAAGERGRHKRNPSEEVPPRHSQEGRGRRWSTRRRPPDRGATSTTTRRSTRSRRRFAARRAPPLGGSSNGASLAPLPLSLLEKERISVSSDWNSPELINCARCIVLGCAWFPRIPQDLASSGGKCSLFKWVRGTNCLFLLNLPLFLHSLGFPLHWGCIVRYTWVLESVTRV
jgi:hypothetical protein